ncbi:MAG: DUF1523 family protein [Paracoccaceae bacterium]
MRYVRFGLFFSIAIIVVAFFHYSLPQHDIVRITGTYNRVTAVGKNQIFYARPDASTSEASTTRDIRFIEAVRENNNVIVYRNEDTGWIWPPYFKWDSSNVQAEASNLKSDKASPVWVSITHYGWRMSWLSIYPNAVSITEVAGPSATIIPWFNIVFFIFFAGLITYLYRAWIRFRKNTLEPILADLHDQLDQIKANGQASHNKIYVRWVAFKAIINGIFRNP